MRIKKYLQKIITINFFLCFQVSLMWHSILIHPDCVGHYLENMITPWGTLFLPRLSQLSRISSLSFPDSFSILGPASNTSSSRGETHNSSTEQEGSVVVKPWCSIESTDETSANPPGKQSGASSECNLKKVGGMAAGDILSRDAQAYCTFLRSVFSLNFLWCSQVEGSVCVCLYVFVCVQATALPETLMHLLSLSTAHGAFRETSSATLLSVTLASISLPFPFASWCALSPAVGMLFMPLREKKRDLSLLLQSGCSKPQLLLQVNQGLKQTAMNAQHPMHFTKCLAFVLLLNNQGRQTRSQDGQEITTKARLSESADVLRQVMCTANWGLYHLFQGVYFVAYIWKPCI